jgi:hypothetical protein
MATDRYGRTISVDDELLLVGRARAVDSDDLLVTVGTRPARIAAADTQRLADTPKGVVHWHVGFENLSGAGVANVPFYIGDCRWDPALGLQLMAPMDMVLRRVSVQTRHATFSDPGDWLLKTFVNTVEVASDELDTSSSAGGASVLTDLKPDIELSAGDRWYMTATGTALQFLLIRIDILAEISTL